MRAEGDSDSTAATHKQMCGLITAYPRMFTFSKAKARDCEWPWLRAAAAATCYVFRLAATLQKPAMGGYAASATQQIVTEDAQHGFALMSVW